MSHYDSEGFIASDVPTVDGHADPLARANLREAIIDQAEAVRLLQRSYFANRNRAVLDRCRAAETQLDALISAYRHGQPVATQGSLL